jgi:myosin heavy subunit
LYRYRVALQHYTYLKQHKFAILIQKYIRRIIYYIRYKNLRVKVIKIHSMFRQYPVRIKYTNYLRVSCAIKIQSHIRKINTQKQWKFLKIRCIQVQNWWRQQRSFQIILQKKKEASDITYLQSYICELKYQLQNQSVSKVEEVSVEKYQQEIRLLKKRIEETNNKNKELSLNVTHIQEKYRNLEKKNEEIESKKNQEESDLFFLKETNHKLLLDIQGLKERIPTCKEKHSNATQTNNKISNSVIDMRDSNKFTNNIENRKSKNSIESSYFILDKFKRDKNISKLEKQYHKSLDAVHLQLQRRDAEINILQRKLDDTLFKINSMESILIAENQIKRELLIKVRKLSN